MASTTATPANDSPKLLKKATKPAAAPVQTVFGCPHVKGLLSSVRQQATEGYAKIIAALAKAKEGGSLNDRFYKSTTGPTAACAHVTYLCLQCPNVSASREKHSPNHKFSVESSQGHVYCTECRDFVYDQTFEEIRAPNAKKRKYSAVAAEGDKKLVATNAAVTPCSATGLRGLYNMGQTCFMSVILQSLIHNPLIRAYYLSEGHRSSDHAGDACTSCALDDIFTDYYANDKHEGYGAVAMLQGCWKGGGGLAGYSQQDAHEFFGFILNSLHEANTEDEEKPAKPSDAKDCECIVHQTFGGLLRSTVTCSTCKNTTTSLDPVMDLSLDVKNANFSIKKKKLAMINGTQTVKEALPMDLTECLERFTNAETLSTDSYFCRKCDANREAKKKLSLARLPPVLPIHLKRFSHTKSNSQSTKVETKVRFPFTLDLAPYLSPSSKAKEKAAEEEDPDTIDVKKRGSGEKDVAAVELEPVYELSSVIVHKGKIDNGHYVNYARQGTEWFRFDDSMVVLVDEKEVLGAEAYMLFYVVREF